MGWSSRKYTADGRRILKILAVATDEPALMPNEVSIGEPFRGDGTDSCSRNPPTVEFAGRLLKSRDIFLLGLISEATYKYDSALKRWKSYLQRMKTRGVITEVDMFEPSMLIDRVITSLDELVCKEGKSCRYHENYLTS